MDDEKGIAAALWSIAEALRGLYDVQEARFVREFPPPGTPRDATISRVKTQEDLLREDQGSSDESLEEWVGFREREFVEAAEAKSGPGSTEGAGRPAPPRRRPRGGGSGSKD